MPLYGEDSILPTTLDEKLSKLMQHLRSCRCLVDCLYDGMNILGVTGLTAVQTATLKMSGAIEY
ncbi:MAG: hypothetical protein PUP93_07030 [Rhizonema sp. NSF051]|nr:hypothetical protein [Rhizonema sp. NSF051]